MSKGVLLFAHNNEKVDYFAMAVATAKRANHFLNLPVTVVTDEKTDLSKYDYQFDDVVVIEADTSNKRDNNTWINKGRFKAWDISPYDETILMDTDYMINSDKLLTTFELYDDFMCHDRTSFLMWPDAPQEYLSNKAMNTLWATVMTFNKSDRTQQIFDCMGMIQKNYDHYSNLYGFVGGLYRNDYSLTIALRIINGHTDNKSDFIPWNLLHAGQNTKIMKNSNDEFNTEYTVLYDNWQRGKIRKEYMTIKDTDFHVMNKRNFMELLSDE